MDWGHIAAATSSILTFVGFVVLYTKVVRSYAQTQADIADTKKELANTRADVAEAVKERAVLEATLTKHMAPDSPLQHINPELERRSYQEAREHRQWTGSKLEKIEDILRALTLK